MDFSSSIITRSQSFVLMQPRQRTLNHPALNAQAAAMLRVAFRQHRFNPFAAQPLAMRLRVIASIALQLARPLARTAALAAHRRDLEHQRFQLSDVIGISAC